MFLPLPSVSVFDYDSWPDVMSVGWSNVSYNWGIAGDVTGDTVVNQLDLNAVTTNWQASAPEPAATSAPEPGTLVVLCIGGVVLFRRRG